MLYYIKGVHAMNDQGLEKIPAEYRARCWQMAKSAAMNSWTVYKTAVMQMAFGGVSSEAEAQRLYYAEQLGHKLFLSEDLKPSQMAQVLSDEIQNGFQHHSRPISTALEPEKQLIEIVNYYFSTEESLQNFYAALNGNLDEAPILESTKAESYQVTSPIESFDFDFAEEEAPTTLAQSQYQPAVEINPFHSFKNNSPANERPLVKAYLAGKDVSLPENIRRIIDEIYP